jgi:hypothetical protein
MFNLPPDRIWNPKTDSEAQGKRPMSNSQGKRPVSNSQGKRPVSGTSSGLIHTEIRNSFDRDQRYSPGPASRPVYPDSRDSNARDLGCVAGPASRPARSQTVSSTSTVQGPVDSPMNPSPTGKEGDVLGASHGESDLAPPPRVNLIALVDLRYIWERQAAVYSRSAPAYHNDSTQLSAVGPDVPSEDSRGSYEQNPHDAGSFVNGDSGPTMQMIPTSSAAHPSYLEGSVSLEHNAAPFVDRSSCPIMQMAPNTSAANPSYPEGSISYVAALRMKREQKQREKQELEEERRRLAWEEYNNMMKERKRKEDERKSRFERPKTVEERENCIRKHMDMLSQRASHVCKDSHCFEEACTIDLPERQGCRYADSFHSQNTSPCVWGRGLMMRAYSSEFGEKAAMETSLDEIVDWYRQRCKHGQRIRSYTLVRDPPGAPVEGRNVFWVKNPSELNGQSSEYPMGK